MFDPGERRLIWSRVLAILSLLGGLVHGQSQGRTGSTTGDEGTRPAVTTPVPVPIPPSALQPGFCEYKTVNYITHILPQQCLTSAPSATATPELSHAAPAVTPSSSAEAIAQASREGNASHDEHELDSDGNDLSTGAFMSFEEWKQMMLQKSGQDPLEARAHKGQEARSEAFSGDGLDTLGDEGEINFDAYSDKISADISSSTRPANRGHKQEPVIDKVAFDDGLTQHYRSKDAGKTCKERFSYSSFDAGATVLKATPGAQDANRILVENKDAYMLFKCSMENKFFIVELSDDILVDTVVLANFEFFSSILRDFRVSVSDRYPVKLDKWKVLGKYQARNTREIQPFLIENPQIWARYLRIEILTHYGNEFYCPISLLRVHGTRMLDSWKETESGDMDGEEDGSKSMASEQAEEGPIEHTEVVLDEVQVPDATKPPVEDDLVVQSRCPVPYWNSSYFDYMYPANATCEVLEYSTSTEDAMASATPMDQQPNDTTEQAASTFSGPHSTTHKPAPNTVPATSSHSSPGEVAGHAPPTWTGDTAGPSTPPPASAPPRPSQMAISKVMTNVSARASTGHAPKAVPRPKTPKSAKAPVHRPATGSPTTSSRNKTTTTTSAPAAAPTVQDSFFKQLTKRLQTLESNTTLSLQYIESQSRFLQEALAKLERRQITKVDNFLTTLNKTVLSELREIRTQYDQIWQSTVIALETQREQSEREIVALSSRLGVLADELIFQKRMAIVQTVLVVLCLVVVLFPRQLASAGMELYYPSQFLPSSRLSSPIFPSTPKALSKMMRGAMAASSPAEDSADPLCRSNGSTPQLQLGSSSNSSRDSAQKRPRPPEPGAGKARPTPSTRALSDGAALDFSDDSSSQSDAIGYDSEPNPSPDRQSPSPTPAPPPALPPPLHPNDLPNGDSYSDMPANHAADRQLTPSSDATDRPAYPPSSSTHRLSRPASSHKTPAIKPLPALPEDPG